MRDLPSKIGVYLIYEGEDLLYIGKAKNIQKRVSQHLKSDAIWKNRITKVDYVLVETENEALETEKELIQRLKPHYNVLLRDDKNSAFIAIGYDEKYPRIYVTRRRDLGKIKYFGPYQSRRRAEQIVDLLPKIFPFRSCTGKEPGRSEVPCLDYYLGQCPGPCVFNVKESYLSNIEKLERVLSGDTEEIVSKMESDMKRSAKRGQFEKAATIRDRIKLIRSIETKKLLGPNENIDFVVFEKNLLLIHKIRNGKVAGIESFKIKSVAEGCLFLIEKYQDERPSEVVSEEAMAKDIAVAHPGIKVIQSPRGRKREIFENTKKTASWKTKKPEESTVDSGIKDLEDRLGFKINRIEGFDASNMAGEDGYVSMVVFEGGGPKKSDYRVFKSNQKKPDDYKAIRNALQKRKSRFKKDSPSFKNKPDLVIIDGGPGQLNAATQALKEFIDPERIISIAKKEERVFGQKGEILIGKTPGWRLILRVRDEAHRFALRHHRKARMKKIDSSPLESISGLGPKRIAAIEKNIKDIDSASADDFESVPGISPKMAEKIWLSLNRR